SISSGVVGICLLALSSAAACGQAQSSNGSGVSGAAPSTAAGSGGAAASAGGATANGGTTTDQHSGQAGAVQLNVDSGGASQMSGSSDSNVGGGCAATIVKAETQTLAMFIMLDQSKSMDQIVDPATMTSRWGA